MFHGKLAAILGIENQPATPQAITSLYEGYSPDGVRLPKYMHHDRRGAFEVTVSLPKCGSVLNQLAKDSRIDDVLDKAAEAVALAVQREARVKVTKKSEVEKSKAKIPKGWRYPERKPDNLCWVSFDHPTSRAGDPHRHRHIVFFNLSYEKSERTVKAIETRYIDMPSLTRLFHRETVKGLRQLGYRVKTTAKEFEIVGVPAEVKAKFSTRHEQIKEIEERFAANSTGKMSAKEKSKLSLYERPEKVILPLEQRRASWLSRISGDQFSRLTDMVRAASRAASRSPMRQQLSQRLDRLRRFALQREEGSSERGRGFSR